MISVQHHNHKLTLRNCPDGVQVSLFLEGRYVGSTVVEDAPFHVVLDRAHEWVRERAWPVPADLIHLKP